MPGSGCLHLQIISAQRWQLGAESKRFHHPSGLHSAAYSVSFCRLNKRLPSCLEELIIYRRAGTSPVSAERDASRGSALPGVGGSGEELAPVPPRSPGWSAPPLTDPQVR